MSGAVPGELTTLLDAVHEGDPQAKSRVLEMVYDSLRRLATAQMQGERSDHTLEPTALVHEVYLRLMGDAPSRWQNRAHFFGAAAEAMRRILVDHARSRLAKKRGGELKQVAMHDRMASPDYCFEEVLGVDEALNRLADVDPEKCRIVQLRYFAGLTVEEAAEAMGISERSVKRHWRFAKAWLYRELGKA